MADQEQPELIIVRRRSSLDSEEGSHGVWKIAFADFMTAMMAFFLVMWLISATNQETRESVANYFNPVKLTDSTPDRKGLNEARRVDPGKADEDESLMPRPEPGKSPPLARRSQPAQASRDGEAALFRDPYAVLSEIAGAPPRIAEVGAALDSNRSEGWKGGEAYKDPYDPIYWPMASVAPLEKSTQGDKDISSLPLDADAAAPHDGKGPRPSDGKPDATAARISTAAGDRQASLKPIGLFADDGSMRAPTANPPPGPPASATSPGSATTPATAMTPPATAAAAAAGATAPAAGATAPAAAAPPAAAAAPASTDKGQPAAAAAAKEQLQAEADKLRDAISAALAPLGSAHPVAEVKVSDEGLLINLTDDVNYGMFVIGSAEPTQGLVRALDKITPLIAQSRGQVIVRGHTDNRAYRTQEYDNWRLSTARAHMAYYMLIRGGLEERRIDRIEGYADHRPKNQSDPSAAENRRIELLIRAPKS